MCDLPEWLRGQESERPEWLIDTEKGCLTRLHDSSVDYITLSYTWGQTPALMTLRENLAEMQQPGRLRVLSEGKHMPDTIRCAIAVTRSLGQRYLWVDSLCIVQDDEACKKRALPKMHLIYATYVMLSLAYSQYYKEFGPRGWSLVIPNLSSISRWYGTQVLTSLSGEDARPRSSNRAS